MRIRKSLSDYEDRPEAMVSYLQHYGPHFSKKLCDYAISLMTTGKDNRALQPYTKEEVDTLLLNNNIKLEYNTLRDYVYVANMCKADFLGSSIPNESYLSKYVKDVIDDVDGYDGLIFNRWYADMCCNGIPIDWEDML